MSEITRLETKIETLLAQTDSAKNAHAIAQYRHAKLLNKADQAAADISNHKKRLLAVKKQGRDAVFELMLRSSHRRFMKFLANHSRS